MSIPRWLRPLIVWLLARRKGLTHKEIGARAGIPPYTVSYRLTKDELDDEEFEEMLPAVQARPAHAAVSTVLLGALDGLDQEDVAALELAALLLDEGRTAEVKAMTPELAKVFEAQGVHREALAALELFKEAAEQEAASAAFAREVLRFLFRAQHDESLRFES